MRLNLSAMPFPIAPFVFTVLTSTFAGDSKRLPSIYVIIQTIPVFQLGLSEALEAESTKSYPSSKIPCQSVDQHCNMDRAGSQARL